MPGALGVDEFFKNPDAVRALTAGWRYREVSKAAAEVSFTAPAAAPADVRHLDPVYVFTSPTTQRTRILNGTIPIIKLKSSPTAELATTARLVFARSQKNGKSILVEELFTTEYAPWNAVALGDQRNVQLNGSLHLNYDSGAQEVTLQPDETFVIFLTNTTTLITVADCTITIGMYFQDTI